jgi:hypothetical protein
MKERVNALLESRNPQGDPEAFTYLKCYIDVVCYHNTCKNYDVKCDDNDVLNYLSQFYPEQTIKTAIENYKKEIK